VPNEKESVILSKKINCVERDCTAVSKTVEDLGALLLSYAAKMDGKATAPRAWRKPEQLWELSQRALRIRRALR